MILTVDELREHVSSDLPDSALQRLLDAAEYEIVDRIGEPGARTELIGGGSRYLTVSRPIDSVSTVVETMLNDSQTLDATDYRTRFGGFLIERIITGLHGRFRWWGDVSVTYTPIDDSALRATVQIDLCKLALTSNPGLIAETIGAWTEQYASNALWNSTVEHDAILSRLDPDIGLLVVGGPNVWAIP
jgi:hypothetical protein